MQDRNNKKAQFAQPKKKNLLPAIAMAALVVVGLGLAAWNFMGGDKGGKFPEASASQGQILVPVAEVSDGKAHFFTYKSGGTDVNFLVLKSSDGEIRAALDTCDTCYRSHRGYRQEGDYMVCNQCDQRFQSTLINEVKGGCNPVPLQRAVVDGNVFIPEADLAQGVFYFQVDR